MSMEPREPASVRVRPRQLLWALAGGLVAVTAAAAWLRTGALDLPSPPDTSLAQSGLAGLDDLARLDAFLRGGDNTDLTGAAARLDASTLEAAHLIRRGFADVEQGDVVAGLERAREGVRRDPGNLVFGNAYRMLVFRLRREFLLDAGAHAVLAPTFPPHLEHQPIAFFEQLAAEQPVYPVRLQLALAWVDEMLLFPALEIKAPSSVQSVGILSQLLQAEPGYVPALYARGMNHLHRPARLVWPESEHTPPDAAARDLALCVAIGRKFGAGSRRLQANLALALGDAHVKAGRYGVARSWWQIAQNLSHDAGLQAAVRRRYGWRDDEMIDRLEADLDRARSQLELPMTDLALMWS